MVVIFDVAIALYLQRQFRKRDGCRVVCRGKPFADAQEIRLEFRDKPALEPTLMAAPENVEPSAAHSSHSGQQAKGTHHPGPERHLAGPAVYSMLFTEHG